MIPLINLEDEEGEEVAYNDYFNEKLSKNELMDIEKSLKNGNLNKCLILEYILHVLVIVSSILEVIFAAIFKDIIASSELVRSISNDLINNFNTGYFMNFSKCPSPYESSLTQNKRKLSDNLVIVKKIKKYFNQ